jgi:thiol-disulfide isomerase/thioredoxin
MKTLSSICVLAGLIPACIAQGQATIKKSPELAFSIPGQGQRLLSQYRGKVVALEFVLTTCPHCQAASKVMTGMQERYGSRGLQALDIAIDPNADLLVENFAKDYHVGFPVGWATLEQMMAYMGFTDRPVVPQLTLIDRNGNIHYQTPRTGDPESMKPEVISQRIEELLAEGKSSAVARAHHAGRGGM